MADETAWVSRADTRHEACLGSRYAALRLRQLCVSDSHLSGLADHPDPFVYTLTMELSIPYGVAGVDAIAFVPPGPVVGVTGLTLDSQVESIGLVRSCRSKDSCIDDLCVPS